MADYNVQSSDGTFTVNVQTGTINNTFDIPFIGQDAINYGDDLVAAQLRLLENFSNTTEPAFGTTRVKGQLWYDSTPVTGRLNIFDGTSFDKIPLDIDVVHRTGAETISDVKTFSSAPVFIAAGAPLTVNSNTVVSNLNADQLDGLHATAFATSAQGILADNAQIALPPNTGSDGFVLSSTLAGVFTWISPSISSGQINVNTTETLDTTTNLILVDDATLGSVQDPRYSAGLTYNANTKTLSTLFFVGALTGNATTATTATTAATATVATNVTVDTNVSTDTTTYPLLVGASTATDQLPFIDNVDLSYDASTGALSSVSFVGAGSLITALNFSSGTHTGTLAVARGGTGVTTATGTGSAFALQDSPAFTTEIATPRVASSTSVDIEWNGTNMVSTQDRTATGNTSGATVRSHANEVLDVGFNVTPQFSWDTSDILEASHCGHLTGHSDGSVHTLTLEASGTVDFPVGGVTSIVNGSAADYTVTEGSGTTLFYIEPGIGGTDTTGGVVIGAGGVTTLYRFSAAIYYIWGSEIGFTP